MKIKTKDSITIVSLIIFCLGWLRFGEGIQTIWHEGPLGLGCWDISCGVVAVITGSLGFLRERLKSKKVKLVPKLPWGWDFIIVAFLIAVMILFAVDLIFF
jgi:hypothetical protein